MFSAQKWAEMLRAEFSGSVRCEIQKKTVRRELRREMQRNYATDLQAMTALATLPMPPKRLRDFRSRRRRAAARSELLSRPYSRVQRATERKPKQRESGRPPRICPFRCHRCPVRVATCLGPRSWQPLRLQGPSRFCSLHREKMGKTVPGQPSTSFCSSCPQVHGAALGLPGVV